MNDPRYSPDSRGKTNELLREIRDALRDIAAALRPVPPQVPDTSTEIGRMVARVDERHAANPGEIIHRRVHRE